MSRLLVLASLVLASLVLAAGCGPSADSADAGTPDATTQQPDAGEQGADAGSPTADGGDPMTDGGDVTGDAGSTTPTLEDNRAWLRIDESARAGYQEGRVVEGLWTLGGTAESAGQQSVLFETATRELELRLNFLSPTSGAAACGANPGAGQAPRLQLQRTVAPLSQFRARDATGSCAIDLTVTGTTFEGTFSGTLVDSAGTDTIRISGGFRFAAGD